MRISKIIMNSCHAHFLYLILFSSGCNVSYDFIKFLACLFTSRSSITVEVSQVTIAFCTVKWNWKQNRRYNIQGGMSCILLCRGWIRVKCAKYIHAIYVIGKSCQRTTMNKVPMVSFGGKQVCFHLNRRLLCTFGIGLTLIFIEKIEKKNR